MRVRRPATLPAPVLMPIRRHHHSEFSNVTRLVERKQRLGQRIAVCIPTLNEADTIGQIVATIRGNLMDQHPLVDELLVVDSGSTDATRRLAAEAGATVHLSADIRPDTGTLPGKGENLWKALLATTSDIICYIDGDIDGFHPGFVTGLVGPLLDFPETEYVKAYYERPLAINGAHHPTGGGRVSEIVVRPLLSLFYPQLCDLFQPLAGEYAARRQTLESLAFPTGYGVETAHLIDLFAAGKLPNMAQTDLEQRHHRNRSDTELGRMAFAILRVILRRLERDGKLTLATALPEFHRAWSFENGTPLETTTHLPEPERPPLRPSRF
jgi:glucosyl-3-phosphoglycerate synthase